MVPCLLAPKNVTIKVLSALLNYLLHDGSKVSLKLELVLFKRLEHLVQVLRAK